MNERAVKSSKNSFENTDGASTQAGAHKTQPRHGMVGFALAGLVVSMLGLSYAAVPLYKIFCQVTGYAGTTQRAVVAPEKIIDQTILVRFDANASRDLDWQFKPLQRSVTVRIGEERLAFYTATNNSSEVVTGTATFNVTPAVAGSYFSKIDCFCFTEQTLQPGETVQMPVSFFIDPDMLDDPDMKHVREITLSYTFFEAKQQKTAQKSEKSALLRKKGSL